MFNSIYFNGNEYKEMWLNGNMIWEKDSGGVVYPYNDADSVVTFRNTSTSSVSKTFTVIDSSLPYSINGVETTTFSFPSGETQVKFVNLKPCSYALTSSTFFPVKFEQLRLPNLTNLDGIFARFGYNSSYTYSWSPQYFEFSDNVTNMSRMFYYNKYITDEMMAQFMPYFPNTSQVTTMSNMFYYCQSLTTLNLPLDTSNVTDMQYMFYRCAKLSSINLSFDTSKVTTMIWMFAYCESLVNATLSFNVSSLTNISNLFRYCYALLSVDLTSWNTSTIETHVSTFGSVTGTTVHVGDGWTLGTESTFGSGTDLVFMRNGETIDIRGDIVLSTTSISCFESISFGDLNGLGVCLSQCPSNAQTVTYTYTSDRVATWSNTFTFDSTNWDTYQYVYFTPALDGLYTDRTDTITFTSDGVESKVCSVKVYNAESEDSGGDSGEIVYPYSDADSVITYRNTATYSSTKYFTVIDSSLPYSINGTSTTSFSFPASSETQVKLVNLKPTTSTSSSFFPIKIEQLRIPNLTDFSYLFAYFGYSNSYTYSWSPEYFEFNENPTNMSRMFYNCRYLSQQQMAQFMEHFKTFNTSQVENMSYMFYYNYMTTELDLSSFDTRAVTSYSSMFYQVANATIYIGDNWTLGTESTFAGGTGLTFVQSSSGGDSSSGDSGETTDSLLVDWTQSTAPTLPSYMTEYYNSSPYGWTHGTFTTGVYGLKSDNFSVDGTTAYICYKYVAPKSGYLNITYRCSSESSYDFLTVHANTSTSQPTYTSSTNRVVYTSGTTYASTDGLATVQVTSGTTYYIHIQYRKDSSGMDGADRGCIRKIELVD